MCFSKAMSVALFYFLHPLIPFYMFVFLHGKHWLWFCLNTFLLFEVEMWSMPHNSLFKKMCWQCQKGPEMRKQHFEDFNGTRTCRIYGWNESVSLYQHFLSLHKARFSRKCEGLGWFQIQVYICISNRFSNWKSI